MAEDKKQILLYYSPRILPDDSDDDNDENNNDTPNNNVMINKKKSIKHMKRFIHSIIRQEKEKFHELLPKIDINGGNASKNRWTPILWAVQKNRLYYLEEMLKSNQIIDFSKHIDHKTQRTTLHFAAEKVNIELLMLLLNKNKKQQEIQKNPKIELKINALDREQCTALYRAAKNGGPLIIKILLLHNANPNILNRDGISPLIIASQRGHLHAVQQLLSDKRIDVNLIDDRGRNALMVCCAEDRYEIAKLLVHIENINLNAVDNQNFNWNCFMWAIYRKNEKILNLLMDNDKYKDNKRGFRVDYNHQSVEYDISNPAQNALDMCKRKKLSINVTDKLRSKYHSILFPALAKSNIIIQLKIPVVVISRLLAFTY